MRKALSLILALVMCLSLCACGGNSKNIDPQIEVLGKWTYDTGNCVWTYIFYSDGSCTYCSSTNTPLTTTTYYLVGEKIVVEMTASNGMRCDWEFTYKVKRGKFILCYGDWEFTKDKDYSYKI